MVFSVEYVHECAAGWWDMSAHQSLVDRLLDVASLNQKRVSVRAAQFVCSANHVVFY